MTREEGEGVAGKDSEAGTPSVCMACSGVAAGICQCGLEFILNTFLLIVFLYIFFH